LKSVDSVADAVEDIALGTANGPMRRGEPFSRVESAAATIARVEGPPVPTISPVRGLEMMLSSRPASAIACVIDMWHQPAPSPMKRMARLSTWSSGMAFGLPATCDLKPFSAYSGMNAMPDLPVFRLSETSLIVSPMDETMPMPVMTTLRRSGPLAAIAMSLP